MLQIGFLPATAATQAAQLVLAFILSGIVGVGAVLFTLVSGIGFPGAGSSLCAGTSSPA
jgi:uncharacterized membrane protein YczE